MTDMPIINRGTGFTESELVLAAQERDYPTMEHHLAGMLPREVSKLAMAAELLADACRAELRRRIEAAKTTKEGS